MMFDFFKSNRNPEDNSHLVIPPKCKPIPFFVTSSSGIKVESNSDFNHSNPIMLFVCPSGLPTYATFVAHFLTIHVNIEEEESKLPPSKKPKNNCDISRKCWDVWATQFPWVEMLRSETRDVHHLKCLVCSFVKGKDVILGPKVNTFEKHVRKKVV